jgi:hypothetical protein
MVVASTSLAALPEDALAEAGLQLATAGFARLEREELSELGALFTQVYRSLGSANEQWMAGYVERLRSASLTADESRRGRALLTQGVNALPPARRERLRALLERAIAAGVQGRRDAEQRAQDYRTFANAGVASAGGGAGRAEPARRDPAATPEPPAEAANRSESRAAPAGGGEAYWRGRMQQARERVARLEAEVQRLDSAATGLAFDPPPMECVPPERLNSTTQARYEACQKELQNLPLRRQAAHAQAIQRVEKARQDLAEAKRALESLEDEARRAGALPGWLRD